MAKKKEYSCVLVETDDEGITWTTFNLSGVDSPQLAALY
jgi:hypothetical protein